MARAALACAGRGVWAGAEQRLLAREGRPVPPQGHDARQRTRRFEGWKLAIDQHARRAQWRGEHAGGGQQGAAHWRGQVLQVMSPCSCVHSDSCARQRRGVHVIRQNQSRRQALPGRRVAEAHDLNLRSIPAWSACKMRAILPLHASATMNVEFDFCQTVILPGCSWQHAGTLNWICPTAPERTRRTRRGTTWLSSPVTPRRR